MVIGRAKRLLRKQSNLFRFKRYYQATKAVDFEGFGEFRGESFPQHGSENWLDQPDAERRIDRRLRAGTIDAAQAEACRFWAANGYLIVPGLIDDATLDSVWARYEDALATGVFGERRYAAGSRTLGDRVLNPHVKLSPIGELQRHRDILKWTDLLLGREALPFQTIIGHAGSQQNAHSDSIHMTSYPLGFLIANWIAFEDIHADSGPLEYYPGSHKLRYLLSSDVGIAPHEFKERGYSVYREKYEPALIKECEDAGLSRQSFLANKGDVLFWHANLAHGGSRRADPEKSRKALVCHYFGKGTVTYHDLSGNASSFHKDGIYTPATA